MRSGEGGRLDDRATMGPKLPHETWGSRGGGEFSTPAADGTQTRHSGSPDESR
jgi:hypothetical protein